MLISPVEKIKSITNQSMNKETPKQVYQTQMHKIHF